MNKDSQKKLAKIFVLTDLLITEIDDPIKTPTKETKLIQDKAKELQTMLEPVLNRFYSGQAAKSTFFIEIANKIEFIFNKAYKIH
jgi:hypothetical protein